MALAIRFLPHSVQLTGGVAAWINQIDSASPNSGITLFEESSGSGVDREFVAAKDIHPTLAISTSDLSFLTTCGFAGIPLIGGANTLTAWARELPFGAVPTAIATAHHIKMVCTDGLLVPMSISAGHNAVAKLSLMLHGSLGTPATPFVFTANTAITTGAGNTVNIYTAGPVKFGARLVQGIADLKVDFGIGVLKESDSGEVYPTHISITSRMSKVEFTTKDVELITEIGDGIAVTTFAAYFRMVTASGQRVPAGTATHISVSGTAGMITPGAVSLTHKAAGSASFTYTPALNTNLITISATAAIPTT